jgi:hypothetical protein
MLIGDKVAQRLDWWLRVGNEDAVERAPQDIQR